MNILTTDELRKKEIINLCDGVRLGHSCDFEFDKCTAQISALIILRENGFFGLGEGERLIIPWHKIECIGEDTILVNLDKNEVSCFYKKIKKPFP